MQNALKRFILFKTSKIVENRWTFTSYSGQYSDSPRCVSEMLHTVDPEAEIVWLVDQENLNLLPGYVKGVDIKSFEAERYLATSKVIFDNQYTRSAANLRKGLKRQILSRYSVWLHDKKGQFVYSTWHGTPIKCMARDQVGNDVIGFVCNKNYTMIHGNTYTENIMRALSYYKIHSVLLGSPRNDILFQEKPKLSLDLPEEKKVLLFAPTFRNDGIDTQGKNVGRSGLDQLQAFRFDELFAALNRKFGGDWILVCRFHRYVASLVNWEELQKKYPDKIINGNLGCDMAEYLARADILLTDASSCMFDFALTRKPCFLFFPDYEHYTKTERGVYRDITSFPFPLSLTFGELLTSISQFDPAGYEERVQQLLDEFGFVDDGMSSERVVRHILSAVRSRP